MFPVAPIFQKTKFTYSFRVLTFELRNTQNDTPLQEIFPALLKEEYSIPIESCTKHNDVKAQSGLQANSMYKYSVRTYVHVYQRLTLVLPR